MRCGRRRRSASSTGVAYDSRAVTPGQVFVALKGQHADGTAFARQAIERGAAAIVSEQPAPDGVHVPWAIVEDARLALAVLAAAFYRDPSREMRVIGITGTNGKTTTAYLVAVDLRRRRHPLRHPRHRRLPHRRRSARSDADDARSAGRAGAAARDGRQAVRRLRDGSVVARAVAAPRRRHHLRRGHLHEPDARSSRLPRRHGRLLPREAAAVRDAAARRAEPDQPRRSARRRRSSRPAAGR